LVIDENFVKKFKNLNSLNLQNAVSSLPSNLGDLNINFFAVTNTPDIESIPESMDRLVDEGILKLCSFAGSNPNLKVPKKIREAIENGDIIGYLP
jgi:hypothetical protein